MSPTPPNAKPTGTASGAAAAGASSTPKASDPKPGAPPAGTKPETVPPPAPPAPGAGAPPAEAPAAKKRSASANKIFVLVGEVLEFDSAAKAEKHLNAEGAPDGYVVVRGKRIGPNKRVSLRG